MKIIPRLRPKINLNWPCFALQHGHFSSLGGDAPSASQIEGGCHES